MQEVVLRVNGALREDFMVKVVIHQGSIISPLLFIRHVKALCEFRPGCPQESLYVDDLVLIAVSIRELIEKFKKWKEGMETEGLQINMENTKKNGDCDTVSVRCSGTLDVILCM